MSKPYTVYILECADGTLYTGITNDPERRLKAHSEGKGAKYTRSRRPLKLVYQKVCGEKGEALREELRIKALSREKKLCLIRGEE
ncbi:MAG: GIY-YIG nuclease family protein [Lachnospiraceae bacterium]|nr:GIY-YIG nuclease family protein [Lachnospiraceae bacterium]